MNQAATGGGRTKGTAEAIVALLGLAGHTPTHPPEDNSVLGRAS